MALPALAVREIVGLPRLWRPPDSPAMIEGVMNRRGEPIPVIGLARLLGLPPDQPGPFSPLVVLSDGWALAADRAVDVVSWPSACEKPAPADLTFNDCVARVAPGPGGRLWPILSPERLLQRRERSILEAFAHRARARREEWRHAGQH